MSTEVETRSLQLAPAGRRNESLIKTAGKNLKHKNMKTIADNVIGVLEAFLNDLSRAPLTRSYMRLLRMLLFVIKSDPSVFPFFLLAR